jgi:hypothetical protein
VTSSLGTTSKASALKLRSNDETAELLSCAKRCPFGQRCGLVEEEPAVSNTGSERAHVTTVRVPAKLGKSSGHTTESVDLQPVNHLCAVERETPSISALPRTVYP